MEKPSEALRRLVEELDARVEHRKQAYETKDRSHRDSYTFLQMRWEAESCANIARRHLAAAEERERSEQDG